jgi:hypothetical protein
MLLVGILFGLVTVGFVVPCLIDVAVTPAGELRRFTKPVWVLIIVFCSAFGATAWVVAGRPDRYRRAVLPRYLEGTRSISQQEAYRRHPAGRSMDPSIDGRPEISFHPGELARGPMGPDDDEAFLEELARRIRYNRDA